MSRSKWTVLTTHNSRVPWGSGLGPGPFHLSINNVELGMSCKTSEFADDSKLFQDGIDVDYEALQKHLSKLHEWEKTWQVRLNVEVK